MPLWSNTKGTIHRSRVEARSQQQTCHGPSECLEPDVENASRQCRQARKERGDGDGRIEMGTGNWTGSKDEQRKDKDRRKSAE
jgi:hypothetical protein